MGETAKTLCNAFLSFFGRGDGMTAPRKPPPPADLSVRGRAFWRATLRLFELSEVELERELLKECSRLPDECESLREAVDSDGVTVVGSTGQTRVHPTLEELRQHRLALGKLLAQLALPDDADETLRSPASARGRNAAQKGWAAQSRLVVLTRVAPLPFNYTSRS